MFFNFSHVFFCIFFVLGKLENLQYFCEMFSVFQVCVCVCLWEKQLEKFANT